MYLVGVFERDTYGDTPMWQVKSVSQATRDHLVKAKADDNYQVINLAERTYYDATNNQWVKFEQK